MNRGRPRGDDEAVPPGDEDLALTETAAASPTALRQSNTELASQLGKFRIQSLLGAGGMGQVYEAFDPELERRVAVKVLLDTGSEEGRARLLREARAMAKLSHPNVITVFEVGTVGDKDYVAMELFPGGTLGDWLGREAPREREVLAAFVAAGRGLAAAHAQGLVHRDFKPGNVLRDARGRIVVTDFGLARTVGEGAPVVADDGGAGPPPSTIETRTGALMGTPAYMAPEQWTGERVTPATDQFAFCVALWEALAGKRPYGGATLDELRAGVLRGPRELDDSAIPRRLRPILRRGLALAPAERWPSMDALLDAIERTTRARRRLVGAIAAGGFAVAAVAVGFGVAHHGAAQRPGSDCDPSAIDPGAVGRLAASSPVAPQARAALAAWHHEREAACRAPRAVRSARLACLDGVLARIDDALQSGSALDPGALDVELVDPATCNRTPPPHLVEPIDRDLAAAFAALRQASGLGPAPTGLDTLAASGDPCVQTVALLAKVARYDPVIARARDMADASNAANRLRTLAGCNDDALRVAATLVSTDHTRPESMKKAEAAVASLPTAAFRAALDEAHAYQVLDTRSDDAIPLLERAGAYHAAHHELRAELRDLFASDHARLERGTPADLAAVIAAAGAHRAEAARAGLEPDLVHDAAVARWRLGEVAKADALMAHLTYAPPSAEYIDGQVSPIAVDGEVVDAAGHPVAGARVEASVVLIGDGETVASNVISYASITAATTDARGHFALPAARGVIAAVAGEARSPAARVAPHVTLRLAPTTRIEGTVALGGRPAGTMRVLVSGNGDDAPAQAVSAPVLPDGRFVVSGVLPGRVQVSAYSYAEMMPTAATAVVVPATGATGVALAIHDAPPLSVIARSAAEGVPDHVILFVFAGRHDVHGTMGEVFRQLGGPIQTLVPSVVDLAHVPDRLRGKVEADDLEADLSPRPSADLTICGAAMPRKLLNETQAARSRAMMQLDSGCAAAGPQDTSIVVELPAQHRLEQ